MKKRNIIKTVAKFYPEQMAKKYISIAIKMALCLEKCLICLLPSLLKHVPMAATLCVRGKEQEGDMKRMMEREIEKMNREQIRKI